nr:MAG TPA: hypothetical protein [Bacteriophage sp.]
MQQMQNIKQKKMHLQKKKQMNYIFLKQLN